MCRAPVLLAWSNGPESLNPMAPGQSAGAGMGKGELGARKDYVVYRGWLRRSYGPSSLKRKH
jgi:hypothetical protein